jgi:hypothetical protein
VLETPRTLRHAPSDELQWINPLQLPNWDDLLFTHPHATVFHSSSWFRVLAETYGFVPHFLLRCSHDTLSGLLPLMEVNSWITGKRAVGLPFTDASAPLVSDTVSLQTMFSAARSEGLARKWKSIELRDVPDQSHNASSTYYEHSLDLSRSEKDLLQGLSPSMNRAIRKAEKAQLTIRHFTSCEAVQEYYSLHQLTRKKHGLPPQPFSFFQQIHSSLIQKGNGLTFLASQSGKAIAGAIFLFLGGKAVYKFGASDPQALESRPNNLLIWNAIKALKELGCSNLSFGRTSMSQEGLRRFKLGFGAQERQLHYSKFDLKQNLFVRESELPSRLSPLFRHCPTSLARLVGTVLYPHIA